MNLRLIELEVALPRTFEAGAERQAGETAAAAQAGEVARASAVKREKETRSVREVHQAGLFSPPLRSSTAGETKGGRFDVRL
ncbi:MAG: hypothetical protein IMW86_02585 [Hydrogenibacillus sp.]|nr:hypothetical protein [Hydrogenibacillus sp.]MBE3595910.1 hypothetical protein [Hydrogenibacillus sp.]